MVRRSSARGKLCMPEPREAFKKWLHAGRQGQAGAAGAGGCEVEVGGELLLLLLLFYFLLSIILIN